MKTQILKNLKGQLIVSCQALEEEALYSKDGGVMPLMAIAAQQGNAKGIRANGVRDIFEIKQTVDLPVIGIIKKKYSGFEQHITVTMKEIDALVESKAEIIALDCTLRPRPDGLTVSEYIGKIKEKYPNQLLMADISNFEEGKNAEKAGVDFIGTTLSGYTSYTKDAPAPDFDLIEKLARELNTPVIAEGRIRRPEQAKKAIQLGAFAVVVGGAITRPKEITEEFVRCIHS